MNRLLNSLSLTLTLGALATALVLALNLEAALQSSALTGLAIGTLVGASVLVLKARLMSQAKDARAAVGQALKAQGLGFAVRLVVVGVGAFSLARAGSDPLPFALAFLVLYFGQQVVEFKYMAAANRGASEVTS